MPMEATEDVELELKVVVSWHVSAGDPTLVLYKSSKYS